MDKINAFLEEVKILYKENEDLKNKLEEITKENNNYLIEINSLKSLLEKKPSIKPSVSLWENSQNLINEKEKEIEYLKKQLKFYERKNSIENKIIPDTKEDIKEKNELIKKSNETKDNLDETKDNLEETNEVVKETNEVVEKSKKKKKKKKVIIEDNEDLERELGLL